MLKNPIVSKTNMSHCVSSSDDKFANMPYGDTGQTRGKVNDAEKQFLIWLHKVGVMFLRLTDSERIRTLDYLLNLCGSKELGYLSNILPSLLYRDFLRLLPAEISLRVLLLLDERSLLNCSQVSKQWNHLINGFREVWIHMARRVGARVPMESSVPAHFYKNLFINSAHIVQTMNNKLAFEEMTLEGHRGRVMAITSNRDMIATGSDDHTVRFWDIHSGECVKVIQTHSVSALQFDSIYLYTASYDNTAASWDIDNGQLVCSYMGHVSAVFSLDARRDLDLIVTGSADQTVKLWQLHSGELLKTLSDWHQDWITSVKIVSHWFPTTNNVRTEHGTLHLVSIDRQCCCFWTIRNNDTVELDAPTPGDWCMRAPFHTYGNGISVCYWHQKEFVQTLSTYVVETLKGKCVARLAASSMILPKELPKKQTVLGVGQKFSIFIVDEGYSRAVIVDRFSSKIVCSIPIPPFRPTQNGASVTLGNCDWLDGFTDTNRSGLFLALCLKDNNILLLKWKEHG